MKKKQSQTNALRKKENLPEILSENLDKIRGEFISTCFETG